MVRAILDGRKTQTRRIIKFKRLSRIRRGRLFYSTTYNSWAIEGGDASLELVECPHGRVGDRIWVREAWQYSPQRYCSCPQPSEPSPCDAWADGTGCYSNRSGVVYRASGDSAPAWRPSIFMPRWASRITLEVTDVRVERLHDISEADATAEGVERPVERYVVPGSMPVQYTELEHRDYFQNLWDSINGKRPGCSWGDNPWVWALTFRRL